MKKFLILTFIIVIAGCSSSKELIKVWPTEKTGIIFVKYGPSIHEAKTPDGFILTPYDISEMCSYLKYVIVIYADTTNYYVAKVSASPKKAKEFGECVNGRTGMITHPQKKNRHSIRYIKPYKKIK